MHKKVWLAAALAIVGILAMQTPAWASNVLLVTDADGDLLGDETFPGASAADALVVARLQGLGHTVIVRDDTLFSPADVSGQHLIIIGPTASSGGVNGNANWNSTANPNWGNSTGVRNLPVPLILMENGLMDELGFVNLVSTGQGAYQSPSGKLTISDPLSPLAAGLSGDVTVLSGHNGADPGQGFTATGLIAKLPTGWSQVARHTDFYPGFNLSTIAYGPTGASLGAGSGAVGNVATAPANRIGFFLEKATANYLTSDGWALFDAAVGAALVPEPSTWALSVSGLVAVAAAWMRRRKK